MNHKIGDLVVCPRSEKNQLPVNWDGAVGIIVDLSMQPKRVGVMWSDEPDHVCHEPADWLTVVSKTR